MGMIPSNAQPILDARKKGLKPVEMILVSLIGRLNELNHTVHANPPAMQYEWIWARGLQICIYTTAGVQWRDVARSIASVRPSYLGIWDAERKQGAQVYLIPTPADIDKPRSEWLLELDFLPWLPSQNKEFTCS